MNLLQKTILIIEDEESIYDILSYALRKEGFRVVGASTGAKAMETFQGIEVDLIILDLMLPDMTGFELCKKITAITNTPILMLTARDDIVDKIVGLELGAEDYVTKPFDIREVIARINVLLRRNSTQSTYRFIQVNDNISINPRAHSVFKNDEVILLKPKEYELLLLFAQHKNQVFSREEILDTVWEMDYEGGLRTVDVHVQRIRKKLEPSIIETVFGIGYKMKGN
ncbi:response regulator transcription factor [Sporosarcina obsidiansis]|uniref:response regulator transcription factor n=1 Tax=Sporosarcina obsidiansis TaxID=2660748 RepID=UPI00129A9E07|nr:response regulator transcription factor [Sporosarcina obsidiansis]